MSKESTIRDVITAVYGEEFPALSVFTPEQWHMRFKHWPGDKAMEVTLEHTYAVAKYLKEPHANVIDAILAHCGCANNTLL